MTAAGLVVDWSAERGAFEAAQRAGPAPLEQSWAYGDAIAAVSRNSVLRGVVRCGTHADATVLAVRRALPGGLRLVRIVRGPVMADRKASPERPARAVRHAFPPGRRDLVFWMPDIGEDVAPMLMRPLGKRPMTRGYTTAWLDLKPDPTALRAGLRPNWRNKVTGAERRSLTLVHRAHTPDVDTFVAGYVADRRAKRYAGPPEKFIRAIADAFERDLLLVRAEDRGRTIAAAMFPIHGASATYYLSWTTPAGRSAKAANLLLWDAILRLREAGIRWLDLGGLDARAPGIARFKVGLGAAPEIFSGTWF